MRDIEKLVREANGGDKHALESVIFEIKDLVYNLSLKMLLFPEDAQDASQEILIRIVTRLSSFKGQSQFKTWVYKVATNYLLTTRGKLAGKFAMPFEDYADFIDSGQSDRVTTSTNQGEQRLLEEEVKVSCTQGLLLCLDSQHRMAYIGEILEFNSKEASLILAVNPDTFRQQISRARKKIRSFLSSKCGLVRKENPCRCVKKIDFLANQQLVDSKNLRFARFEERSIDLMQTISHLESEVAIYRTNPSFEAPEIIVRNIKKTLSNVE